MKLYLKEKGSLILTFIIFYLLIEFITFRWVDFAGFAQSFFIDFFLAIAVGSFALLFRSNKASIIYLTVILGFVMTLFLINATMYSVYFDLFTLQQLTLIGEATNVFNFDFLSIPSIIIAVVITFLYYLSIRYLWKKMYRYYEQIPNYYRKTAIVLLSTFIIITSFFLSGIKTFERYRSNMIVTTFKRASLEEYGILGYYLKEADIMMFGIKIDNFLDSGDDLIPIEESIETEYFGLLENANILTIMVESLQPFAVNEVLTPNLYMFTQEGIYFPNNYSENKTNVSEMIGMTGNYPTIPFLPFHYNYDFSHSLPNILKTVHSYNTAYYHDNVGSFYSRDKLFGPLGFQRSYFHYDLFPGEKMWTWDGDYTPDSVTVEKVLDNMDLNGDAFYYYWSTMSMHGPYNYGPKNKLLFEDSGYFSAIDQASEDGTWTNPLVDGATADMMRIRHYQAAVMDFDVALGRLLEELELKNLLDNTIIVLYGDHNVYYHELSLVLNNSSSSEYYNTDMYETFLAIYNPVLTEKYLETNDSNQIEKFVSPYNIVPTLFDLLGLTYNQNIMMANSVFTDTREAFYSHKLTAFFDDKLYSNDGFEIMFYKEEVEDFYVEEFLETTEKLRDRLVIINYWYDRTKESRR